MPLLFLIAGLILVVTGINGTTKEAGALIKQDFTGPNNFFVWAFAIFIAGAIGYVPTLKPLSYAFLVLVFVVILLTSGKGFFDKFKEAMNELNNGQVFTSRASGVQQTNSNGSNVLDHIASSVFDKLSQDLMSI